MLIIVALIALIVALCYYALERHYSYWLRHGIPHDPPSFPKGNFGAYPKRQQFSHIFKDYYLKFKNAACPFAGFYFFFSRTAVVTDLELIKKVLIEDFNNFESRGLFHNEIDDPLSATLVNLEGQKWRNLRHKLTPTFTSGKMKFMFPTVIKVGQEMSKIFAEQTRDSSLLEITELVGRFTADVIGSCAFGLECNSLRNPKADFVTMGRRAILEQRYGGHLNFFIFGFPKLARLLHLKLTVPDVENFYLRIVRETITYRVENNVKRNDFMNIMIEMYQKHEAGNEVEGLSFEELAAQAFIFFLAGFETSSTTMGFALYELAQHQEIQSKLREEIVETLAKHKGEFSYESMKEMKYLAQVVMETLRKYPIVGHLRRLAYNDYSTGDSKQLIPKGSTVIISVLGVHYDPDIYEEPQQFKPERFTEENIGARHSCAWLPFGQGPRNCIGSRFGLMQTQIGLAYLIKDFQFSVTSKTQVPLKFNNKPFLLAAENGIHLNVERIGK